MNNRPTVIFSAVLLVLSTLYFIGISSGVVTVRAESRAKRGAFNNDGEETVFEGADGNRAGYLRIPLPDEVEESDIKVAGDIYNKMIIISITGADEDFYKDNFFSGDMTGIDDVRYGCADGISTVELNTEAVSVPVTEYTKGSFFVRVVPPDEVYDRIIVLDGGHSGRDDPGSVVYGIEERSITHAVAQKVYEKLNSEDTFVYFTSVENPDLSEEDKIRIAEDLNADMLISIHTGADPDTRVTNGVGAAATGGLKNSASDLTSALAETCGQKDLGVSPRNLVSPVGEISVPALRVKLGFITNKAEAEKMNTAEYQEKAALVIADFIDTVTE